MNNYRMTPTRIGSANNRLRGLDTGRSAVGPLDEVKFSRMTCAELDAESYRVDYLIQDALVAGQPCIFAGTKKVLKTSIIIDAAISLATEGDFLGRLSIERATRVGLMSGESGMATIQETARRIAHAKGLKLGEITGLVFSDMLPKLEDLEHLDALGRFIADDGLQVLILDPIYLCMSGDDAGNLFKQGRILRGVNEVCQAADCTLMLVHHTRKNIADPFRPPELEDIAWAGFQEWARQWWLAGRREQYEPGTGEHKLWFNVGGSAGHSALWAVDICEGVKRSLEPVWRYWEVQTMRADEARRDATERQQTERDAAKTAKLAQQLQGDMAAVVRVLARYPEGETQTQIRQEVGANNQRVAAALGELRDAAEIVPCSVQKQNRQTPYEGYKLAEG